MHVAEEDCQQLQISCQQPKHAIVGVGARARLVLHHHHIRRGEGGDPAHAILKALVGAGLCLGHGGHHEGRDAAVTDFEGNIIVVAKLQVLLDVANEVSRDKDVDWGVGIW
jgi:hypothetical protein